MKFKSIILLAAILAAVLVTACSSDSGNSEAPKSNTPTKNSNVNVSVPNQPDANANSGNTVTVVNSNANRPTNQLREPTLAAKPAPDNSTFTSTMDKDGTFIEVREFKDNPSIIKVVRKMYVDKSKYFVYLKSGKVVEAPADKMKDFRVIAPSNILEAIGMKPATAPVNANVTREMKMKQQ